MGLVPFDLAVHAVLLGDLADDSCRIAGSQHTLGDISCHNTARTDDTARANADPTADGDVGGNPHVMANDDGLTVFKIVRVAVVVEKDPALICNQGMNARCQGTVWTDKDVVANLGCAAGNKGKVNIGLKIFA